MCRSGGADRGNAHSIASSVFRNAAFHKSTIDGRPGQADGTVPCMGTSARSIQGAGTGQALRGPGLLRPQQPISAGGRPRFAEVDLIPRLRLDAEQPLCDAKSKHQEHEDLCEHGRVLCLVCSTIAVKRRLLALAANSCDRQHVFAFYGILPTMVRCQDALAAARRLVTTPSASPCQGMVRLPRWTGEPW